MKTKIFALFLLFAAVIAAVTAGLCMTYRQSPSVNLAGQNTVALNEIDHLNRMGRAEEAAQKLEELNAMLEQSTNHPADHQPMIALGICCVALTGIMLLFVYFRILRPFERLKYFASEIAKGNLDIPLKAERGNYFGDFTRSFDTMRLEINESRRREKEAIENNKTVIASLAHDIKTPIASLRAYSEALMIGIASTPEKRERYCRVLLKKCDEVTNLTNDLFIHSVSDLDKLSIKKEVFDVCEFMSEDIRELNIAKDYIHLSLPDFSFDICADRHRLAQIVQNIVFNARKYAKTDIDVFFEKQDDNIMFTFRDYGGGIPDEDMPFAFDKFYRGHNSENEEGSGLGLYIVRYLTEKMGGTVLLHNRNDGLDIHFTFPPAPEKNNSKRQIVSV